MELFIRPIIVEFNNYKTMDQLHLNKLILKYKNVIINLNKNKHFNTYIRDKKIQRLIKGGYTDAIEEKFNLNEIKNEWLSIINNLLIPVEEFYNINKTNPKEKLECECGGKYTYSNKSTHLNTQIHKNYFKDASL
jgi:hypothetical protein